MSFSWVPATHRRTHIHTCAHAWQLSARKECSLFPSVHQHHDFRQPAFLLPEVSSLSHWAVTGNPHFLNDPFYWAGSLLSGPKEKRADGPQKGDERTRAVRPYIIPFIYNCECPLRASRGPCSWGRSPSPSDIMSFRAQICV